MLCNLNRKYLARRDFLVQIGKQFDRKNVHSTVDKSDVEHHSKLADRWWDINGPVAPLHSLNNIR